MQFGRFHRFAKETGDLSNPHESLTARLTEDLDFLAEHEGLTPDLILCTGDLAEWGLPQEFSDAFAFLERFCAHLRLPRERCAVIPGNHDVNRMLCSAYFDRCKGYGESPEEPWFPKWEPYKKAFDRFYAGVADVSFTEDHPFSLFAIDELQVVIAGLNSTMDEGHDGAVKDKDRADPGHHGLCGEPQYRWFQQRLREPRFEGWLKVGAVHHNAIRGCRRDDENLRDAELLGGVLGRDLHLLLHGHTHEAKAGVLGRGLLVYSTGSASLQTGGADAPVPTDVPNQYQLLRIAAGGITRYCRQYAPRNEPPRFIGDVSQSETGGDWVIRDDANLRDVRSLAAEGEAAEDKRAVEETRKPAEAAGLDYIPSPPAFYAEPDYIGSHRFVGRAKELEELNDWAKPADQANMLLFEAIGGEGKSMLTWEWTNHHAMRVRQDWAGRFWYSFYERGAIMADFCRRALSYMTGQPLEELRKKKTAEMRESLLRQLHERPWLLVLDGLERVLVAYHRIDAAELSDDRVADATDPIADRDPRDAIREEDNDLLRALAASGPSKILVSSRLTPRVLVSSAGQDIVGVRSMRLRGLRPPDAERLLRSCGVEGDSAEIQSDLTTHCDNHPLVVGVLAGPVRNYLPDRGNFGAWVQDPEGGAKLDLASLDLKQRRNHTLLAALEALPPAGRQLLSTLALLSESADYEMLSAFNPHLPPEPEEVAEPAPPESHWRWSRMSKSERAELRVRYKRSRKERRIYEEEVQAWLHSNKYREATKKLSLTVADLEQRGLLQYEHNTRRYDLHPVVRGVAAGRLKAEDREQFGQKVI
ncbi:MAG: metallophosphoesterase, partial [Acidobacteriota bacterium]